MLVLSRKVGQAINIGDDISVEVRRVAGNRVTLALSAPKDVRILRGELKETVDSFETSEISEPAASTSGPAPVIEFTTILATA